MSQVLPQMETHTTVDRIKGFRYPAPGSRTGAKIPRRSEEELYDTNFFKSDPRNLPSEVIENNSLILLSLYMFIDLLFFTWYGKGCSSSCSQVSW